MRRSATKIINGAYDRLQSCDNLREALDLEADEMGAGDSPRAEAEVALCQAARQVLPERPDYYGSTHYTAVEDRFPSSLERLIRIAKEIAEEM